MTQDHDKLKALIARVELANGADREIDVAIAVAVDWRWDDWEEGEATAARQAAKHGLYWLTSRAVVGVASVWRNIPAYTASLDAAMTLVPEGAEIGWRITDGAGGPTAEIWYVDLDQGRVLWEVGANPTATPALALTAAAIRARLAMMEEG